MLVLAMFAWRFEVPEGRLEVALISLGLEKAKVSQSALYCLERQCPLIERPGGLFQR